MGTPLSVEERVELAADKGANIALEDWQGEDAQAELGSFLDSLDVPREKDE